MTGHSPPGKRRAPVVTPEPDSLLPTAFPTFDPVRVPRSATEPVYVVHVQCGQLGWRRLYLTTESAWAYAGRMTRLGHQAEIATATLIGGAL